MNTPKYVSTFYWKNSNGFLYYVSSEVCNICIGFFEEGRNRADEQTKVFTG
jgi:hypothetical protein